MKKNNCPLFALVAIVAMVVVVGLVVFLSNSTARVATTPTVIFEDTNAVGEGMQVVTPSLALEEATKAGEGIRVVTTCDGNETPEVVPYCSCVAYMEAQYSREAARELCVPFLKKE